MRRDEIIDAVWASRPPRFDLPVDLVVPANVMLEFMRAHPGLPVPRSVRFDIKGAQIIGTLDAVDVVVEAAIITRVVHVETLDRKTVRVEVQE